ncbi:MAG: hypothetical protein KGQ79_03420 [Proteobacteria bacterium]|nr:hypothetical protein [Pseudomonadota bacterium]MDE2392027.1 hypothetical protein [Rhodospirillales bacterium]
MSDSGSLAPNSLGLSNGQIDRLTTLQEAGRKLDFVYHYTDDGSDPRRVANQFDEFRSHLKAFAEEGEMPRHFAAALWDHLAPRFVGWRPEFIEGVEARHLTGILMRLDEHIDARLGRAIPQDLRAVSQEVRARFDDLLFLYESGEWRDTRTPGEVRDELVFVASLDEKIRNVLYGTTRDIDIRKTVEDNRTLRDVGGEHFAEAASEAKAYQTQLAKVSDILDRTRAAGVEVRAGLTFGEEVEKSRSATANAVRAATPARPVLSDKNMQRAAAAPRRPPANAETYWRDVARSASGEPVLQQSRSLAQPTRRGRFL